MLGSGTELSLSFESDADIIVDNFATVEGGAVAILSTENQNSAPLSDRFRRSPAAGVRFGEASHPGPGAKAAKLRLQKPITKGDVRKLCKDVLQGLLQEFGGNLRTATTADPGPSKVRSDDAGWWEPDTWNNGWDQDDGADANVDALGRAQVAGRSDSGWWEPSTWTQDWAEASAPWRAQVAGRIDSGWWEPSTWTQDWEEAPAPWRAQAAGSSDSGWWVPSNWTQDWDEAPARRVQLDHKALREVPRDHGARVPARRVEQVAHSQENWQVAKELWVAKPPQAVGWTTSPASLAEELDVSDGVAWCFFTHNPEEAEEAADLIQAAVGDDASHSLTILFDGHADALGDWATGARLTAVPGRVDGRLVLRKLWIITSGSSAAALCTKESQPLQVSTRPPKPHVQRASSVVVRFVFDQNYNLNWEKIVKKPGHFARLWASGFGIAQGSILDTWGWQLEGSTQVRGLLRVDSIAAARTLWERSGFTAGGCSAFINLLGDFKDKERKDFRVQWVPWVPKERYTEYLRRVQGLAKHGIVLGRSLGIRLAADDPALRESPCLWRARAIPVHWQLEHVTALMHDVGFREIQVQSKHRSKHGADWLFKAMRRDGSDVVQRDLYWDPDDEETAELVVIREGARRSRKASTQAIPSSFAVDFAQLVKTAAGAKGPNQGPQGKGAGRRNSAVPAAEAPKSANGEPDSGKQSRERLGPGTKRRADDAEADVDLEGETPPVWKLNATLRDNPGAGNCLYYALGMSGVGGKEYNHRQVRRWVQQNLLYFESDFQEMWTNGGQFNCSGRTAACTWNEYLSEQMQNASWGGALEIAAFSRGAEVRTWVVDASDGTVHLINPTGAKGSIALHFDPERQHYQCYVDYVEQHLEARYTELGGKCFTHDNLLRGGGPCSTVSLRHRGVPKRQPAPVLSDCASPCPKRGAGVSTAAKGPRFLTLSECASEPAEVDQGSCAKRRRLMQSSGIAPAISDCASSEGHSYVASVMGPSSSLSERRRIVGQRSSPPALSDCSSGLACCRSACEVPRASPPALHLVPVPRVACRLGNCCGSAPEDVPVPSPAQNGRPVLSLSERRRIVGKRSRPPALSECTSGRSCCRVECEVPCASPPAPQLLPVPHVARLAGDCSDPAPEVVPVPFPAQALARAAASAEVSESRRSVAHKAWPTPADLRTLSSGSLSTHADRATVRHVRRRLKRKTCPWLPLAAVGAAAPPVTVPACALEDAVDLGEPEAVVPKRKGRKPSGRANLPSRWECDVEGCTFVASGLPQQVASKRYYHNKYRHNGMFQVGRKAAPKQLCTICPTQLAVHQKLGWVCPCCDQGFVKEAWESASWQVRAVSARAHRIACHAEVPLEKWHALIKARSGKLPAARGRRRGKKLNACADKAFVEGCETFLWPTWVHKRATISVKHAWRCTGCLHCFFHRRAAVEHECTGLPPCKDMSRLERRLQALGDLDTHVEASGFVRSDFDAIVARCRAALLGDKLSCSSGSAQ